MNEDETTDRDLRDALRRQAQPTDCPPEERWLELLEGRLDQSAAESLRAHLARCARCAAIARDARRFLLALEPEVARPPRAFLLRRPLWLATAAAAALVAAGSLLWHERTDRSTRTAVESLAMELDVPAPPPPATGAPESELVYRDGSDREIAAALERALVLYRARRWSGACAALDRHGREFPQDREARFLAGVACLEAGEPDRAESLLASLASVEGERRDDARELLGRLQRARGR